MKPTHVFNGTDINIPEVVHPLKGVECQLVKRQGLIPSGYDGVVRISIEDYFDMLQKVEPQVWMQNSIQDARDYACEGGWLVKYGDEGDEVEIEANIALELDLLPGYEAWLATSESYKDWRYVKGEPAARLMGYPWGQFGIVSNFWSTWGPSSGFSHQAYTVTPPVLPQ